MSFNACMGILVSEVYLNQIPLENFPPFWIESPQNKINYCVSGFHPSSVSVSMMSINICVCMYYVLFSLNKTKSLLDAISHMYSQIFQCSQISWCFQISQCYQISSISKCSLIPSVSWFSRFLNVLRFY